VFEVIIHATDSHDTHHATLSREVMKDIHWLPKCSTASVYARAVAALGWHLCRIEMVNEPGITHRVVVAVQ
jgi:hypothetical protein